MAELWFKADRWGESDTSGDWATRGEQGFMSWTRPSIIGAAPSARCAHSASYCGKLFILGGWDGQQMLSDCYVLHPGACMLPE